MRTERRRDTSWAGAGLGLLLALAACGPGEARAPNPTRPLDERRAVEVIRKAIAAEGAQPAAGRDAKLPTGKTIHVDVGVDGQKYGIAYVTADDLSELGDAIKPANKKDENLRVERVDDEETRIVVLYQSNYIYDDLAGDTHEQTAITAEKALARDVQDFITYARRKGYK